MKHGLVLAMVLALGASGCATKKFVRVRVDPLSQRVGTLEGQNTEQGEEIDELGKAVSRADERALTADQKAQDAARQAESAGRQAESAGSRADAAGEAATDAKQLADRGLKGVDAMGNRIDSLSKYVLTSETTVQFALESATLDQQAKQKLDDAANSVTPDAPCVVEVQGFTDSTGSAAYNLALSQRRANAVVRYLVAEREIPLRQIHVLGLGSDEPTADNKTRSGRETNRRVEIKVYLADQDAVTALVH